MNQRERAVINTEMENRDIFPEDICGVMGRQCDSKPGSSEFESHLETY